MLLSGKQDEKSTSIGMRECRRKRREGVARLKSRIWRPAGPRKGPCFLAVTAGRTGSGFFTPMRDRGLMKVVTFTPIWSM
jgi:hypothetical protein